MLIDTETMYSMSEANRNFSAVARTVEKSGSAVILKNNKPKFMVVDLEDGSFMPDLTDDEKIDVVAKRVLKKYLPAFRRLSE